MAGQEPSPPPSSRQKTLSVSLQRMTCGPLRGRELFPGGWAIPEPLRLSPSQEKASGAFPFSGEDLVPEVGPNLSPCVSPLHRGEQEGSCDAGILRFPHRLNAPRFAAEPRAPAGLPPQSLVSPTILQETTNTGKPKQTRTGDPRPRRGAKPGPGRCSRCRREALIAGERTGASASLLFGRSERVTPSACAGRMRVPNEPPGRSKRPTVERYGDGRYGERYVFRPHRRYVVARHVGSGRFGEKTRPDVRRPCQTCADPARRDGHEHGCCRKEEMSGANEIRRSGSSDVIGRGPAVHSTTSPQAQPPFEVGFIFPLRAPDGPSERARAR